VGGGSAGVYELIFEVREADEGGYVARAIGESIFVEADDEVGLERVIRDAIRCHFGWGSLPQSTHCRLVRVGAEAP
jgi:hypothetical protein